MDQPRRCLRSGDALLLLAARLLFRRSGDAPAALLRRRSGDAPAAGREPCGGRRQDGAPGDGRGCAEPARTARRLVRTCAPAASRSSKRERKSRTRFNESG